MREIKFRAYNMETKIMLEPFYIGKLINGFNTEGNWSDYEDDQIMNLNYEGGAGYELMQYTGLKDKRGKEIYEGDILRYNYWVNRNPNDNKDFFGEVIFDTRVLDCGERESYHVGFILRDSDGGEYWYTDMPDMDDVEVIGNIYENPNLLESTNHLDLKKGTDDNNKGKR